MYVLPHTEEQYGIYRTKFSKLHISHFDLTYTYLFIIAIILQSFKKITYL